MEEKLRELWADLFKVCAANVTLDDHFVRRGGDSFKAMRLVGEARQLGLAIKVADIMSSPRLSDMASKLLQASDIVVASDCIITTFELLSHVGENEARVHAATFCDLEPHRVQDVFHCTPMQEGLVAMNMADPTAYIWRCTKNLSPHLDTARFCAAFDAVVKAHPVLRTRIIDMPREGFVQVVVSEGVAWTFGHSLDDYQRTDYRLTMGLGQPLVRVALLKQATRRIFALTMHHAIYDGWSIEILFDAIARCYQGLTIVFPPRFQSFVKAIGKPDFQSQGRAAWKAHLAGNESVPFPSHINGSHHHRPDTVRVRSLRNLQWESMAITKAVVVRAALALTMCQMDNVQDIVFGTTVAGRSSIAIPGVEQMTGPTMATVPTRFTLIDDVSEDAKIATAFQTLLVVQPQRLARANEDDIFLESNHSSSLNDEHGAVSRMRYAIVIECQLNDDGLDLRASFDSNAIANAKMEMLISHYETVLHKLCDPEFQSIRLVEVEWIGERDLRKIYTWNAKVPEAVDLPVHELFSPIFQKQPHTQAICAWDGDFTYQELDTLSTRLANHLYHCIGPNPTATPIFIEKSKWVLVAMLAVMKAGFASCLLDSTLPHSRLRSIVEQISPEIMLVSAKQTEVAETLFQMELMLVGATHLSGLTLALPTIPLPAVSPDATLYVVFTSGSTGLPKGVVISHRSMSSSIVYLGPRRSISQQTRELVFSSLAFDGTWHSLHTLYQGGCICMPSETGRQDDLKGSILQLKANFSFLTPTVASTLDNEALDAIDSLVIGGEPADPEEMERIQQHTTVRFIYGPSECTPVTSLTEHPQPHPSSIGRTAGVFSWLVDPQNTNRLAGIGCVGELWLEGPLLGTGYFQDPDRSAIAYVTDPGWMLRDRSGQPGRRGRAYRQTGPPLAQSGCAGTVVS
ncbi:acetyl-CoA synthetase-like protein [Teratosphaeria nubilosa]|uniref:Acetyl-CoA synthetase-like protein n=1 Tax=Teratosphaeria nubilosa TaxID=161662 RepID=A0A6G1KX09_9PEZI|nr:acetyl-CoA synthetase-like protein [Teratosphaeria nubilosa]